MLFENSFCDLQNCKYEVPGSPVNPEQLWTKAATKASLWGLLPPAASRLRRASPSLFVFVFVCFRCCVSLPTAERQSSFRERIISVLPSRGQVSAPRQARSSVASTDLKRRRGCFLLFSFSIKVEGCHYRCAVCAASAKRKLLLHSSVNFLNSLCVYVHVCTHAHIHISSGIWMCLCMDTMCGFSAIQKAPDECSEISIFP